MKNSLKLELGIELFNEIYTILSGKIDKSIFENYDKDKLKKIEKFYVNHMEEVDVQIVYNFLSYFSIFGIECGNVVEDDVDVEVDVSTYYGYIQNIIPIK